MAAGKQAAAGTNAVAAKRQGGPALRRARWLLIVLTLAPASVLLANSIFNGTARGDAAGVDAILSGLVDARDPGLAIAIYRDGSTVLSRIHGMADLEQGTRATPGTQFHVASVSKQFTAFAIALLAHEGRLDLDADIRGYLPYVPDFGHTITIRHLVLHTSGLRDQWSLFHLGGHGMEDRLDGHQILQMVSRQSGLNFVPGTQYMYSNTGYTLLAEIVRIASGQTLRQFTDTRIFKPLGMDRSVFLDDLTELIPGRANSYSGDAAGGWKRQILNYDTVGATGLLTTAGDLAKWARNFAHPRVGDQNVLDLLSSNGHLDDGREIPYGFGLIRKTLGGRTVVLHDGADAGFRALFVYYPEHDFAIAMTSAASRDLLTTAAEIANLYLPPAQQATTMRDDGPPSPGRERSPEPSRMAGSYLNPHAPLLRFHAKNGHLYYGTPVQEEALQADQASSNEQMIFRDDGSFDLGFPEYLFFTAQFGVDGRANAINQHTPQDGGTARYERIDDRAPPDPAALLDYAGDYRSQELDATYTISVNRNGLSMRSLWSNNDVSLSPVIEDRFDASDMQISTVVFGRNDQGRIDRLTVLGGRARNILFDRAQDAGPR